MLSIMHLARGMKYNKKVKSNLKKKKNHFDKMRCKIKKTILYFDFTRLIAWGIFFDEHLKGIY